MKPLRLIFAEVNFDSANVCQRHRGKSRDYIFPSKNLIKTKDIFGSTKTQQNMDFYKVLKVMKYKHVN